MNKKISISLFLLILLCFSNVVFAGELLNWTDMKAVYPNGNYILLEGTGVVVPARMDFLAISMAEGFYPIWVDYDNDGVVEQMSVYDSNADTLASTNYTYLFSTYYSSSFESAEVIMQYMKDNNMTINNITFSSQSTSNNPSNDLDIVESNIPYLFVSCDMSDLLTEVRKLDLSDPSAPPSAPSVFLNEGTTYRFKGSGFNFKMMANTDGYYTYNLFYDSGGMVKHIESSMIAQMGEEEQSILFSADTELQIMIDYIQNGTQVEVRTDAVMESMITDFGTLNVTPVVMTFTTLDSVNNSVALYYDDFHSHTVTIKANMSNVSNYAFFVVEKKVNGNWVKSYSSTVFNDSKDYTIIIKPDERISVFNYGDETVTVTYPILDSVIDYGPYPLDVAFANGYINNPSLDIVPVSSFDESNGSVFEYLVGHGLTEVDTGLPASVTDVEFGTGIEGIFNFFMWLKNTILNALYGVVNLLADIGRYVTLIGSYIGDTASIFADLFGSVPPILWAIVISAIGVRFFFLVAGRN